MQASRPPFAEMIFRRVDQTCFIFLKLSMSLAHRPGHQNASTKSISISSKAPRLPDPPHLMFGSQHGIARTMQQTLKQELLIEYAPYPALTSVSDSYLCG